MRSENRTGAVLVNCPVQFVPRWLEYPQTTSRRNTHHMKRLAGILLLIFGLLQMPLRADVEISFDYFYDQLEPMGEWVEVDGYGYVWHPNGVDAEWAPYTDGYWSYTDAGWTWVSYEDWGAICYHYGRWLWLEDYGWCWVPGYEWGPAWVSWRRSDEYVGWAPLPPECNWEPDRGISVWVDTQYDIGPSYFRFCRIRDFGAPVIRHVVFPRARSVDFCFNTWNVTNISYNRDYGCVFNGGIDYHFIRERCERPVPAFKLVIQNNITNININNNRGTVIVNAPRGNALIVNAPRIAKDNYNVLTRKPAIRQRFDRAVVRRGWSGVDNEGTRSRLISKMREETRGLSPTNSPARPVQKEALAVVPDKADFSAKPVGLTRLPADRKNRGDRGGRNGRDLVVEPGTANPNTPNSASTEPSARPGRGDRGNGRKEAPAEAPATNQTPGTTPEAPAVAERESRGGIRKRPGREAVNDVPEAPGASAQPGRKTAEQPPQVNPDQPPVNPGRGNRPSTAGNLEKPTREGRPNAADPGVPSEAVERPNRRPAIVETQPNEGGLRRRPGMNDEPAPMGTPAEAGRENEARERAAREKAALSNRQQQQDEQLQQQQQQKAAEARQNAAEARQNAGSRARSQQQQDAAENAARAAEMRRRAGDENAARERAENQRNAAEAAARRAQVQDIENANNAARENQRRALEQQQLQQRQQQSAAAERTAAERAAAQRANVERAQENAQRQRAAEVQQQQQAARSQAAAAAAAARERAMDNQRQQAAEAARARAIDVQRQQQAEAARSRAADMQRQQAEARSRAMDAQRQQAQAAQARAAEVQQQRAAAAAQARAQAQAQAQAHAQAQAQQRAAQEAAARRSMEAQRPPSNGGGQQDGRGRGRRGE